MARDYLRIVRRRAPVIVVIALLVPLVAYFTSRSEDPLYEGTAEVLLSRQNLPSLVGVDLTGYEEPARAAQTQASIARTPTVATRALRAAGFNDRSPYSLLGTSSVWADPNTDVLFFAVRSPDRASAATLATAYAEQYIEYRRELDTLPIRSAKEKLQTKIENLEARGRDDTSLYNNLLTQEQRLEELEALLTSNASLLREAEFASQVEPRPTRNAVLGLVLGLALGLALALLAEVLDTRVRSIEEVTERLRVPLLGRIPRLGRRYRSAQGPAKIVASDSVESEAFRMLRTNLDFVNIDRGVRTLMVTSATEREGKSTTIVNLALAFARAGRRVALVDLDLRRPAVARFFEISDHSPGVSDVALGDAALDDALVRVPLTERHPDLEPLHNGRSGGELLVLPSGPTPPDPGEFVGSRTVQEILADVRSRADLVLIDAPPILHVGDALTLSAAVDAVLLVTRLNVLHRSMLNDLARAVEASPAETLGLVVTDAQGPDGYGSLYHRETRNGKPASRRAAKRDRQPN